MRGGYVSRENDLWTKMCIMSKSGPLCITRYHVTLPGKGESAVSRRKGNPVRPLSVGWTAGQRRGAYRIEACI